VPAPVNGARQKSTLFEGQVLVRIIRQLLPQNQDAVERRGAIRATCWPRNSDLYFDVRASSLALSSRARAGLLDFLVLAFDFDILFRKVRAALPSLAARWSAAALSAATEVSPASFLRLFEKAFGLHRRLDAVEHDTDIGRQLLEKRRFPDW